MPDYDDPWYTAVRALYQGDETRTWRGERFAEGTLGRAIPGPVPEESEDCWCFWPKGCKGWAVVDWHDLEFID